MKGTLVVIAADQVSTRRSYNSLPSMPTILRHLSAYAFLFLFACPLLSAELPLAEGAIGPAPYWRANLAAARGDDAALAVWSDTRSTHGEFLSDLFMQFLDNAGKPIGENIRIVRESGKSILWTAVACTGSDYLVSYTTLATGSLLDVRLLRVSPQGKVTPIPGIANAHVDTLTWVGDAFLLAYRNESEYRTPPILAMLNRDGEILRSGVSFTDDTTNVVRYTSAAPGKVLATWIAGDGTARAHVTDTAALLDPGFAPVPGPFTPPGAYRPSHQVASSGTGVLVVWPVRESVTSNKGTYFARAFTLDAKPLGPARQVATTDFLNSDALAWNGHEYSFLFGSNLQTEAKALRLNESGEVLASEVLWTEGRIPYDLVSTDQGVITLSMTYGISGFELSDSSFRFMSQLIPSGATRPVDDGEVISRSLPDQLFPSIAACGDGSFATAWAETVGYRQQIFYRELGQPRKTGWTPARISGYSVDRAKPSVACNERTSIALWADHRFDLSASAYVVAVVIDRTTGAITRVQLPVTPGGPVSVTWNGSQFLLAWQRAETREMTLERWDGDGHPIASSVLQPYEQDEINGRRTGDTGPAVAWTGAEYCAAWQHEFGGPSLSRPFFSTPRSYFLQTARMLPNLVHMTRTASPSDTAYWLDVSAPAVLFDGSSCIVAWGQGPIVLNQTPDVWGPYEIVADRTDAFGALSGPRISLGITPHATPPIGARVAGRPMIATGNRVFALSQTAADLVKQYADDAEIDAIANADHLVLVLSREDKTGVTRLFTDGVPPARRRAAGR